MIRVYNYFCLNENCSDRSQKVKKDDSDNEEVICIHCESSMKLLGEECNFYGRFSAMSIKDRKITLKKRSTDHYKKKIKGFKEHFDNSLKE